MKLAKILVLALAVSLVRPAFAQDAEVEKLMVRGQYYVLSREFAEKLALDYDLILNEYKPTAKEFLAVKIDEQNQIDVSIFDNSQFASARMDIVQQ